jgi:recombination DNA repair RAD52 pathway protein
MLTVQQIDQLLKPINATRVKTRKGGGGKQLAYVEAYAIPPEEPRTKNWQVGYRVIGRLTVTDTGATYTEAAVGMANLPDVGEAHDMAVKTAESDAFKRAAINLGDNFGLSLYNNGSVAPVVRATIAEGGADE